MEKSKAFDVISKINSVLFLVLLLAVGAMIIFGIISSNRWQDRRAVQVVPDGNEEQKIELILGNITCVPGHDTQYVNLRSRARGGKFSSYSRGGETRNVLFFTGENLESHWLYNQHKYLVNDFSLLTYEVNKESPEGKKEKDKIAKAIYIETIKNDTNGNHELDRDDLITISLARPDGKNIKEIEQGIQSVIDFDFMDDNESLLLLFQKDDKVVIKKYSLSSFEALSERVINEISRKQ